MDSLLVVGPTDEKLVGFFKRLGYKLFLEHGGDSVAQAIDKEAIDVILIDSTVDKIGHEFCEFFRKNDRTRDVPIIALCGDKLQALQIKDLLFDKIECIQAPFTWGAVATKVATQLRLRKIHGKDERTASISEVNAMLRDLNEHRDRELNEARSIQKALLPKDLPKGDGYDIAACYKPLEEVGGDWYTVNKLPSGKILIFVADVTGHGLAAAFIGSMTKLALSTTRLEDPGLILGEVNKLMAPNIPSGRFVTANVYLFDPSDGTLQYARGGGPAAILFRGASKGSEEIKGDGFPIGFFEEGEYQTGITKVDEGDIFLITTDGVTEAQNRDKKFYGSEGISEALKSIDENLTAQKTLDGVMSHFNSFLDGRLLKDDVTVVVLTRPKR